jgi:FtsH-binding integral membrane protein
MKYTIGSLFLSHGVSFVHNYLIAGEYKTSKPNDLMTQPYSRIIVMHIAILGGGFLSVKMGSPVGVLIVLIALKTIIDVTLHLRQHRALSQPIQQPV